MDILSLVSLISSLSSSPIPGHNVGRSKRMVVRGADVLTAGDIPWHAVLTFHGNLAPVCGGVLVSMRQVLTAGHCLHFNNQDGQQCPEEFRRYNYRHCRRDRQLCPPGCFRIDPADIQVFLGQIERPDRSSDSVGVSDITLHPEWSWSNDVENNLNDGHDIGIVTLAKQQVFSNSIQAIALPHPYADRYLLEQGTILTVTGFGLTERGKIPFKLQKGDINVTKCARWNRKKLRGEQICGIGADMHSQPVDSCTGDSGGGLYYLGFEKAVLVGVVSFGEKGCNVKKKGRPGVYTNLFKSENYNWIGQQLNNAIKENVDNINSDAETLDDSFVVPNPF